MWFFTSIFGLANSLAQARDTLLAVADRRTEAVANYFERVAQTIEEMQAALADGHPPYEQVARLRACSADFASIVSGLLPDEQAQWLAEDFALLRSAEELLRLYQHPEHGHSIFFELSDSKGTFRGLADALRARL